MSTVDHLASLVPRVCRLFDPWHVPRVDSPCWRRRLHGRNLHRLDRLPNWNCGWSILGIPRCAQLSATFGLTSSYFHGKNHLLHPIDHPFYICYMDLHDLTWLIMLSHFGIDVWIKSIYIICNIWHLMMIKHSWLFSPNIYGKAQWFATIFFPTQSSDTTTAVSLGIGRHWLRVQAYIRKGLQIQRHKQHTMKHKPQIGATYVYVACKDP